MDHDLFYDKNPGFMMRRLQQVSTALYIRSLKEFDLTPLQYTILNIVNSAKSIDQISIARISILDTSTVRDIIERLEAKQLILRTVGEVDRRTRKVTITKAGVAVLEAARPSVEEARTKLLEPLTARECETLMSIVEKVVSAHEATLNFERDRDIWRR